MDKANSETGRATVATILIHLLFILLLFLFGFTVQKHKNDDSGLLVNFGTSETGFGEIDPATGDIAAATSASASSTQQEEEVLTQEIEEAPVIEKKKELVKKTTVTAKNKKTTDTKKENTQEVTPKETITQPIVQERKVDSKSLFPGKTQNGGSSSEGINEGSGDQGDPNGVQGVNNYDGNGTGNGVGFDVNISGRTLTDKLPLPGTNYKKGGIVIVEIYVDKDGIVSRAKAGAQGSTTADLALYKLAEDAARKAHFNVDKNAPPEQRGFITYHFKVTANQ